jgi:hypothetical protein
VASVRFARNVEKLLLAKPEDERRLVRQVLHFVLIGLPILFSPVALVVAVVLIIEAVERKRFSLRALLITMTLLAILLGVTRLFVPPLATQP